MCSKSRCLAIRALTAVALLASLLWRTVWEPLLVAEHDTYWSLPRPAFLLLACLLAVLANASVAYGSQRASHRSMTVSAWHVGVTAVFAGLMILAVFIVTTASEVGDLGAQRRHAELVHISLTTLSLMPPVFVVVQLVFAGAIWILSQQQRARAS
jgi:hypothetical protein